MRKKILVTLLFVFASDVAGTTTNRQRNAHQLGDIMKNYGTLIETRLFFLSLLLLLLLLLSELADISVFVSRAICSNSRSSLSRSLSLSLVFCYCSQSATNIVYFIRPTMKRERDWGKKKKKE
jgi:hypothetical protein